MLLLAIHEPTLAAEPTVIPLPQAHAHNDYLHARPLMDALDRGFCGVEADIFLVDGELLVAHDVLTLDRRRTLRSLYLDPLRKRVKTNGGKVYRDGPPLLLLIDIKSDGPKTYAALSKLLAEYADALSRVEDGKLKAGAITAVISGNRPIREIAAEKVRYAGIDGRLADLESDDPAHLMPLLSDNWTLHFQWTGAGAMPDAERKKLRDTVAAAHLRGRKVRFWSTPESPDAWRELLDAGVDLINTDRLDELRGFLVEHKKAAGKPAR